MKKNKPMSKRGILFDVVMILIVIFSMAVTLLIAKTIYDEIGDGFKESDVMSAQSITSYDEFNVSWSVFDGMIIFVLVALTIGLVITSFMIPTHPIFLVINIIGMAFIVFIAMIISSLYTEISTTADLSNASLSFTNTEYIMSVLPYISVAIILIASVVNWARGEV
jgi:hypothetical protein